MFFLNHVIRMWDPTHHHHGRLQSRRNNNDSKLFRSQWPVLTFLQNQWQQLIQAALMHPLLLLSRIYRNQPHGCHLLQFPRQIIISVILLPVVCTVMLPVRHLKLPQRSATQPLQDQHKYGDTPLRSNLQPYPLCPRLVILNSVHAEPYQYNRKLILIFGHLVFAAFGCNSRLSHQYLIGNRLKLIIFELIYRIKTILGSWGVQQGSSGTLGEYRSSSWQPH